MQNCSLKKETGALLFSGDRIWCSTVIRRKKLVHYSSQGEENWCTTVLGRRKKIPLLDEGSGAILISKRRGLELYCFREEGDLGDGTVPS